MTHAVKLVATKPIAVREENDFPVLRGDYVVIPDGRHNINGEVLVLDQAGADAIIKAFHDQGINLVVDYEHQTCGGKYASPTGIAPAAGWIKGMHYEKGRGLVANIHWTTPASELLRLQEYRYLSPSAAVDPKTRRAIGLHSVGLTNRPAIANFPELIAASATRTRRFLVMADRPEQDEAEQRLDALLADLREVLGMSEDATPKAVLQKTVEKLQGLSDPEAKVAKATTPRAVVIAKAERDFNAEPAHAKIATRQDFVNLYLREAGLERLKIHERLTYG